MKAIMALAKAPSYGQQLAVIKANRQILLSPTADAALTLWIAEISRIEGADSAPVRRLEECQQLLRKSRKLGLGGDGGGGTRPGGQPRLSELITTLVGAGTWTKCRQIIEENRQALLSDRADSAMAMFISQAGAEPGLAEELEQHQLLLKRCRQQGIEQAFAGVGQLTGTICRWRNIVDAVMDFVNADSWDESRRVVQESPDLLLTDDADKTFEQLIRLNQDQPDVVDNIEMHRALLADCRRRGITRAFREL